MLKSRKLFNKNKRYPKRHRKQVYWYTSPILLLRRVLVVNGRLRMMPHAFRIVVIWYKFFRVGQYERYMRRGQYFQIVEYLRSIVACLNRARMSIHFTRSRGFGVWVLLVLLSQRIIDPSLRLMSLAVPSWMMYRMQGNLLRATIHETTTIFCTNTKGEQLQETQHLPEVKKFEAVCFIR